MTKAAETDNREAILSAARAAVQKDGYNALSFRTLAAEVGIKSASVHYFFPTKADLAAALVNRYAVDLAPILEPLNALPFEEAMDGYIRLFRSFFGACNQMCLGGMMAAEVTALPPFVCAEIKALMQVHTDWLSTLLSKKHSRMAPDMLEARAQAIFAALEGALLIARGRGGDAAMFDGIVEAYRTTGLLG